MLINIHLDQLTLSDMNVRKTHISDAQEEMQASLLHHGLQQNLVVVAQSDDAYEVVAGGRRLQAMKAIAEAGELVPNIGENWLVPCQVIEAGDATEISLAENTIRLAMHPADQFEAWSKMVGEGKSTSEVALRFGVNEQIVRRRLKLAAVAPELMEIFRADDITLENLMAFTLTDDHARQLEVWEQVKSNFQVSPNHIRRLLTEGAVGSNTKLARFVGEAEYEWSGGTITRDLFSDHHFFENAALLESLALRKLEAAAEALRSEWGFVQADLDADQALMHEYDTLVPEIVGAPEALMQEYNDVLMRMDEVQNGEFDPEEEDEETLQAEYEELEATQQQLQVQLQPFGQYSIEQKQQSGCFVYVKHDGELEIRYAMQKRQRPAARDSATPGETDSAGEGAPVDATETAYSQSLASDLGIYRTQILQAAIGDDFKAAFDLMTYSLCTKLFTAYGLSITERKTNGMGYIHIPLNIDVTPYSTRTSLQDADSTAAGIKVSEQFDGLSLQWMRLASEQLRFAAFCDLPADEKQKLFSWCVARNMQQGLAGRMSPALEAIAQRLNVRAHEIWRPSETAFFKRLKKPHLLALITDVIGGNWCSRMADQKKSHIAGWLGRVFAANPSATAGMDAAALERIRTWMPALMAYSSHPNAGNDEDTADSGNVVAFSLKEAGEGEATLPEWMLEDAA